MCGIIGYKGNKNALPVIIDGLKNLEYRGYDSSGIAYFNDGEIKIVKEVGKIANLEKILPNDESHIGIGHTRWATHGGASKENAHPHRQGVITLVHNGIIENYQNLKTFLIDKGYTFNSQTDTEIAAGLLDYYYKEDNNILNAISKISEIIEGSYAFGILVDGDDKIYAVKRKSPLIVGVGKDENFIASDIPAILDYTNKYMLIEDDEIVVLSDNVTVYKNNEIIDKEVYEYKDSVDKAKLNNYEHYMIKEINDEPKVVENLISIMKNMETVNLKDYDLIQIIGCGSAYHAGLVGKYLIEETLDIKTEVYLGSEYRYNKIYYTDKTLVIAISQSGETADTLASLLKAKENNCYTVGIINTQLSTIARNCDEVYYINAGLEICVATTKAYLLQVLMFSILVNKTLKLDTDELNYLSNEIIELINRDYSNIVDEIIKKDNIFFIGRGMDYALCMEGSLKLKEVSYLHSEAYAAGELKHGTISLIEDGTIVISVITDTKISDKTISNLKEVKARGAKVIVINTDNVFVPEDVYDYIITMTAGSYLANGIKVCVPMQIIAYYVAKKLGREIDKPRNLAKSVTVE